MNGVLFAHPVALSVRLSRAGQATAAAATALSSRSNCVHGFISSVTRFQKVNRTWRIGVVIGGPGGTLSTPRKIAVRLR